MNEDIYPEDENELRTRLVDVAGKIEAWRLSFKIPKEQMPKRFSQYLKSYRNVERAAAGNLEEIDLEKNLAAMDAVWSLINSPPPKAKEKAYDDLSLAAKLRDAFLRTMVKTGPNRTILVIGPTGVGKTKARQVLMETWKKRVCAVNATKAWRDKPGALLSAIWRALGKSDDLGTGSKALVRLEDELNKERRAIVVDEAHYLGPDQLNTLTTLINSTPGEVILIGQPTLWSRLEQDRGAYLEARQLTRNRLSRRIIVQDLNEHDVEMLLTRRLPALNGTTSRAVKDLIRHASQHGHLAFVRNVIERCEEAAEETNRAADYEMFAAALKDELNER